MTVSKNGALEPTGSELDSRLRGNDEEGLGQAHEESARPSPAQIIAPEIGGKAGKAAL